LTVKNYATWCTLTANGQMVADGTPGVTRSSTICVPSGTINLVAKPLTGFQLGPTPWHGTSGDTGSGDPGTQTMVDAGTNATSTTTVVTTSGSKCVWACCEFSGGGGCSGLANQCP
jgi:hypothetical protein